MIGVSFQLRYDSGSFLSEIFSLIDVHKFIWSIGDNEIIYRDENGHLSTSIFDNELMTGSEFLRSIEKKKYYLVYADIKAFTHREQIRPIETYDDFVQSDCEIALLCTDTVYVEVYCKNESLMNTIIDNCRRFGFSNLQVLSRAENSGNRFGVWD